MIRKKSFEEALWASTDIFIRDELRGTSDVAVVKLKRFSAAGSLPRFFWRVKVMLIERDKLPRRRRGCESTSSSPQFLLSRAGRSDAVIESFISTHL